MGMNCISGVDLRPGEASGLGSADMSGSGRMVEAVDRLTNG